MTDGLEEYGGILIQSEYLKHLDTSELQICQRVLFEPWQKVSCPYRLIGEVFIFQSEYCEPWLPSFPAGWRVAPLTPRFDTISASTFGNQFVGRVANPDEA